MDKVIGSAFGYRIDGTCSLASPQPPSLTMVPNHITEGWFASIQYGSPSPIFGPTSVSYPFVANAVTSSKTKGLTVCQFLETVIWHVRDIPTAFMVHLLHQAAISSRWLFLVKARPVVGYEECRFHCLWRYFDSHWHRSHRLCESSIVFEIQPRSIFLIAVFHPWIKMNSEGHKDLELRDSQGFNIWNLISQSKLNSESIIAWEKVVLNSTLKGALI